MRVITAGLTGTLFGVGLALSGLTDTQKVRGFLDVFGAWDITLLWVMTGALITTFFGYRWVLQRSAPLLADAFVLPTRQEIDRSLIIGALLFGIGWGLVGYCPGPAVAALAYLDAKALIFCIAMLIGLSAAHVIKQRSGQ